MSSRFNRVVTSAVFAVLWMSGLLFWSASRDLPTITSAGITGLIVGLLSYWLFDKFSGRFGA